MNDIAKRQEMIDQGQAFFDANEYAIALAFFQRAQELGNTDASVECSIGDCLYFTSTSGDIDKDGKPMVIVDDMNGLEMAITHIGRALHQSKASTRFLTSMVRALTVKSRWLENLLADQSDENLNLQRDIEKLRG